VSGRYLGGGLPRVFHRFYSWLMVSAVFLLLVLWMGCSTCPW
jgi:hypothetical protein